MNIPTIPAKTIVSGYTECGWFGSNYNMNIYKGCCHGCIYCDSRSECYGVEDFDTVRAKENALQVIEKDLRAKRKKGIVITGSMSDPYNPFEKVCELSRGALQLIDRFGFGVVIDTKSDLVLRDIDILRQIQRHSAAIVNLTITTADDILCRKIERNVIPTSARLNALKILSENGILCGILLMPVLPFINDTPENIREIVQKAARSGARWIYTGGGFGVTLRQNQRIYFYKKLEEEFPSMMQKYIETYGNSYSCTIPNNAELCHAFENECKKYDLLYRMNDIVQFIYASIPKYKYSQLSLPGVE